MRVVVAAAELVSASVAGVKRQLAPAGNPPVHAKVMAEWKPPMGVAVKVTALEDVPCAAVVTMVEGDRVKAPARERTFRGAIGE